MSAYLYYVADYFYPEIIGGAELSDQVVISYLKSKLGENKVRLIRSAEFKYNELASGSVVIVSNFANLSESQKDKLASKGIPYLILERDAKFVITRNLAMYENFKAPPQDIVNKFFYSSAEKVFGLTAKHTELIQMHLNINNLKNLGSTHFSKQQIKILKENIKQEEKRRKKGIVAIVRGKRSNVAEYYCKKNNKKYEVIEKQDYENFISKLSEYSELVFMSHHFESYCRLIVEAKILGLRVIADDRSGVSYEEWFSQNSGLALAKQVETRTQDSLETILKEVKRCYS